jgi:hypothetical protein
LFEKVVKPENSEISNDEVFKIAVKLLDDFELNREIHAELEHYAKTGEILGEHEIFADLRKQRELDALIPAEISKKINNLKSNISKKNKKLKENKNLSQTQKDELSTEIKDLESQKKELDDRLKAKK